MKIGIIGTGHMGSALRKALSRTGHEILIGSRDPEKAAKVGENSKSINTIYCNYEETVKRSDVIFLAVRWRDTLDAIPALGNLDGKILIEISNPFSDDMDGLVFDSSTSAAETLSRHVPGAKIVKAFNHLFADIVEHSQILKYTPQAFYCGDDKDAKEKASAIFKDMGFECINLGQLASARLMESLTILELRILQNQDHDTRYAMEWKNMEAKH
jgi:hypothetical protein